MSYKEIRQTVSKKDCKCKKCEKAIKAHTPCIVDPKKKEVYCIPCGKTINNDNT